MYSVLEAIKDLIKELNIFKSVKIGLEKGADTAKNTPFCRIIVESVEYQGLKKDIILQIVIAFNTKNDLEKLYKEFLDAKESVLNKLFTLPFKVEALNLILDEDRLLNLKAGVLRVAIKDIDED